MAGGIIILAIDGVTPLKNKQKLEEDKLMKTVKLCREGSCCPAVSVFEDRVEIGEDANTCTLTRDEFEILKEKILAKEI
jgi:hypothetical protein